MSLRIILSTLLALFLLSACQVKEKQSSGDLVSGHSPASNKFVLQTPVADTYTNADVLSIVIKFPYAVTVTGSPELSLTVGATARTAVYASGSGTTLLTFQYTIQAADNDSNGVTVNNNVALAGGTLTFDSNGVSTNCTTTFNGATFPLVKVDNTAPTITAFQLVTTPGFYHKGQKIVFHVTYSEAVYVTGTPSIQIDFTTGADGYATYAGGTGTTVLSFEYTILAVNADTDGYAFPTSLVANGTVVDGTGITAAANLAAFTGTVITASNLVEFSGLAPYVVQVTPPANGTYVSNVTLDFVVEFDQNVIVSAANYLELTFTSGTKPANYFSGSGTKLITFRYTTIPGDTDADGIVINRIFGGTITGAGQNFYVGGTYLNNAFYPAIQTGIIMNSPLPQVTAVSILNDTSLSVFPTAIQDGVFIIGETMDIVVNFNVVVKVVQTIGTPYIDLTIGGTVVRAYYLSGDGQTSLVFRYTILEGQSDTDGVDLGSAIVLNGGTITDTAITNAQLTLTTTAFPTRKVDAIRPTVSSITPPANMVYSTVTTPATLDFMVNWSEPVDYSAALSIPMDIGGVSSPAAYNAFNRTAAIRHRYSIVNTRLDTNGVALSSPLTLVAPARVRDAAGNDAVLTFTPPVTTGVLVDAVIPTVTSVTAPAAGRYRTGDPLDFTVTFSESITIAGGSPYFGLLIGLQTRNVTVVTPGTGTVFTFRYTVQASDTGAVSIPSATLALGGSTIRDVGLNNVAPLTFSAPVVSGIIIDEVAPTITSAASTTGTYVSAGGNTMLVFTAVFSEAVVVAGGTPYIEFTAATGTIRADYHAASSNTTDKKFRYTVLSSDLDLDGLATLSANIELNGATIQDVNANDAVLTLPGFSGLTTTLLAPNLTVWMKGSTTNYSGLTVKPSISTSNTSFVGGYYVFNGTTSTLDLGTAGSMTAVYVAMRAPTAGDTYPQDLFSGLSLKNPTASPLIDVQDGGLTSFRSTTGMAGVGSPVNNAIDAGNRQQVEFIYSPATAMPTAFIPAGYSGSVAGMLIFNAALSQDQKDHVIDYLNANYVTDP